MDSLDLIISDKEFFRLEDRDIESFLKQRKRLEDDIFEFKEDFDRNRDGKIKIAEFCKYIVGFSNSESGGFLFYGVKDSIKNKSIPFPDYINKELHLEDEIEVKLQGWMKEQIQRKVYVSIRIFCVTEGKILVIKVPPGPRKPYAYYEPASKSYKFFKKTTKRLEELALEDIETLYFEAFIEYAQRVQGGTGLKPSQQSIITDKIKRHQEFILPKLENIGDYGYFCFYCYPTKSTRIEETKFKETFLDLSKSYSETLNLSPKVETFQDGYTRGYFPTAIKTDIKSTSRVTCYYDGFIALDSQVDDLMDNNKWVHLNSLTYQIQRHLQLSKEILEDYCDEINYWIGLRNIKNFVAPVFRHGKVWETYPYQGTHSPVNSTTKVKDIHGRDRWNVICQPAIEVVKEIARIFGLRDLPDKYWDDDGYLEYAKVCGR